MSRRVGLWLIGARGGVASVVISGLAALQRGLTDNCGLVSCLLTFSGLELLDWPDVAIGGHEIRPGCLVDEVRQFQRSSRTLSDQLLEQIEPELRQADAAIRPGILFRAGDAITRLAAPDIAGDDRPPVEKIAQVVSDLREFRESGQLDHVVMINLASTEPEADVGAIPDTWAELEPTLHQTDCPLPTSSLYAIAAIQSGCSLVNFTPSLASDCAAIRELAKANTIAHAGRDGKTGETLIKSALAPAFAMRNLQVMSWVGHNIFGNMDAQVLDDPENKQAKVATKDGLLGEILGYDPQSHISIEYIRSMGDWKTAWDHIHFRGFLGTPMVMQFTWQGCDSMLAAPLVLDLFRLTERAARAGQSGVLDWLACFFKSPMDVSENNLTHQFSLLQQWAGDLQR